ncbi:hypothetical protein AXG93_4776s1350 [Marchantia polymorpha subsp. ruderalis]|uniref:Reverse transcriptase/retrotransposon-derived protein RNase H-like domain-containing protein n=1 Tax=Marchantia polymorpha subsp. ruderalis TaxID=1480154 RepID=A0A176VSF5_MARPO|nr:hypothetical protein AXG93_4776s1350 [Marchantia polymorpha subsp. ruderalis]
MRLHPEKCKFFQENVEYLNHVIYPSGLEVQQAKVKAIARITRRMDVRRIRAFMGWANFYRRYVKKFNAIAQPLNQFLKLDQEWQWGDEQERAFVELKAKLVAALILWRPIRGSPYQLHIDWSMLELGAVLTQRDDEGKEFVIAKEDDSGVRWHGEANEEMVAGWHASAFMCLLRGYSSRENH